MCYDLKKRTFASMRASLQTAKTSATASRLRVRDCRPITRPPSGLKLWPSTSYVWTEPSSFAAVGMLVPAKQRTWCVSASNGQDKLAFEGHSPWNSSCSQ